MSDTESPSVSPIQKDTSGDNRMHSSPISPPSPKKGSMTDPIDSDHPCGLLSTDAVENLDAMSRKVQMEPPDALRLRINSFASFLFEYNLSSCMDSFSPVNETSFSPFFFGVG